MQIRKGHRYAVITADVIDSAGLAPAARRKLHSWITETGREAQGLFGRRLVPLLPYVFSGDSWQFLVQDPSKAWRVALFFRARLRAISGRDAVRARFAIGIGTVDFIPADTGLADADGEAFRRSGRLLGSLGREQFGLEVGHQRFEEDGRKALIEGVFSLSAALADGWTLRQAECIALDMEDVTQSAIAEKLEIDQSGVARHLDRAGWPAISKGVKAVEKALAEYA